MSWRRFHADEEAQVAKPPASGWPLAGYGPSPAVFGPTDDTPGDPQGACWTKSGDYKEGLPFTPPQERSKNFRRGNFQLKVPGFTNGYNDKDRSILMTWELPSISIADQERCLDYYAQHLHTILYSVPQARNMKVLDKLYAAVERAAQRNLLVVMAALGGDGESFKNDVVPVLDPMVKDGLLTELCSAWQMDKGDKVDENGEPYTRVIPEITMQVADYAYAHDLLTSQHWVNGACALFPYPKYDIHNRDDYGRWAAQYVDCQYHQTGHTAPVDEQQSGAASVLRALHGKTRLCYAEGEAQGQADSAVGGREPYARRKGFIIMCAEGAGRVMDGGYFDQVSYPDGKAL